jgi:hypothetical protein
MGILNFLLPIDELPPLSAVLCADEGSTAYKGGKNAPLYAYEVSFPVARRRSQ